MREGDGWRRVGESERETKGAGDRRSENRQTRSERRTIDREGDDFGETGADSIGHLTQVGAGVRLVDVHDGEGAVLEDAHVWVRDDSLEVAGRR